MSLVASTTVMHILELAHLSAHLNPPSLFTMHGPKKLFPDLYSAALASGQDVYALHYGMNNAVSKVYHYFLSQFIFSRKT